MTYTRKQAVTCMSVLYLIVALGVAGYASSRANYSSVPIPEALAGLTTALPVVAGILLECGYDLTRRRERQQRLERGQIKRPPLVIIANTIIFIYSTVVITLLGTHAAPPSGLDCGLRQRWQTLFRQKDAKAVKRIQDAFDCCGFANPQDMPWPFPNKGTKPTACNVMFDRTNGCFRPWKAEEQRVAGLLMGVVGMVFVWQLLIIAVPTQRDSWLHRMVPDRVSRIIADEEHGSSGPRHAIDYLPDIGRYSDRIEEEANQDQVSIPNRAIEGATHHINGVLPANSQQDQQPITEDVWSRN